MSILLILFLGACVLLLLSSRTDRPPSVKALDKWFFTAPLYMKEKATGYYRGNYNPYNNYEEFEYVASIYWSTLTYSDKLRTYHRVLSYYQKKPAKSYAPKKISYDTFGSE